ncbi:PREDICTED: uncharacterized protein LOC104585973 isoform X2 [Nelumbo nucifera]|uniref:Uncharacterized protein LOC104585973 isoform X2 n=1 Tax=Nelumbo nucifera TaxID=4432 RepID=A0A1U7YU80_NELNU|nr:PREDICTED: uncharacterized protein LOC104585973 isoform X2 [Nelumbo nucifera]
MSSHQGGNLTLDESLTFDEVSKLFSLPIAEAANILGVCSSVLKKICRDNGLIRWPYRKFLSGKSIEEIKKDAARERNRELAQLSKAARQKNESASSILSSTFGSQLQNKMSNSSQQQGSGVQNIRPQHLQNPSLTKGIPDHVDEFKYGFPTDGLSTITVKWWGSSSPDGTEDDVFGDETDQEDKQQSPEKADSSCLTTEEKKPDKGTGENEIGPQGTGLLSSVRKRAAQEGREALKLGYCRNTGAYKLARREEILLLKVFGSSLPNHYTTSS